MKKKKTKKPRIAKSRARKTRKSSKKVNASFRSSSSFGSTGSFRSSSGFSKRWVPSGKTVHIAGRRIHGMIYVGKSDSFDFSYTSDIGLINPDLPVARTGDDFSGSGIPTQVGIYIECTVRARATYLDWLIDRNSTEYSAKYAIMYFTGLEMRFFDDSSSRSEKLQLVAEVERLFDIYSYDSKAKKHFEHFLQVGRLILGLDQKAMPSSNRQQHPSTVAVMAALGIKAIEQETLDGKWLFNWYAVSTVASAGLCRVNPEFKALFVTLFNKEYPRGIKLRVPEEEMALSYRTISDGRIIDLTDEIGYHGDLSDHPLPASVHEIVNQAEQSLTDYIQYVGKKPERRKELAAHILLPVEIRGQFPCQKAEKITSWAQKLTRSFGVVQFKEVVEKIEGTPVERITRTQTIRVIDILAGLFIGLAPDPRLTKSNLKLEDSIMLFEFPQGLGPHDEVGESYWHAFRQLAIACFVAGANMPYEQDGGRRFSSGDVLTAAEQYLLTNYSMWMSKFPPTLHMIRQHLKELSPSAKEELAPIALSRAVVNGIVRPERVEPVKKIYKLLGLDVANVFSDLHSYAMGDEPVTVRRDSKTQQTKEGMAVGESVTRFELDSNRINSVLSDTVQVSEVLGEIFENDSQTTENVQFEDEDAIFPGLDNQHTSLVLELIQRGQWENEEFEQIAGRFNLMPGGALETLNEWAYEKFEQPLIEEFGHYNLNSEVLEQLEVL